MADPADLPEPDAAEGAPHPRHTPRLFGQEAAERAFLDAFRAGRLHHAWLLTGPRGVGKATLAWRIAAFLLARQPSSGTAPPGGDGMPKSLDTDPASPLRRRLAALGEGRLLLLRRGPNEKGEQLETQITRRAVDRLKAFFQMSAADGGRRVVLVDPAEEMNATAANALLKELEEPPPGAVFLMVCHQPHRLLPTIRSRCRELRLGPLSPEALRAAVAQAGIALPEDTRTLHALAGGSAGMAARILAHGGLEVWQGLMALMETVPDLDRRDAIRFSEGFAGRTNEPRLDLALTLIDTALARLARAGVVPAGMPADDVPGAALFTRLAPDAAAGRAWADLQQGLSARARQGKAVNLDPGALILDTLLRMNEAAGAHARIPARS